MAHETLFTRSQVGDAGVRPERDPELHRLRRNVYGPADSVATDDTGRYLDLVRASHLTLTGAHIYSHESAAVLLGIPILDRWPSKVHLIDERRTGGRSQLDIVRHCIGLEHVNPVLAEGKLVTSPARTAFDIAVSRPYEYALVVADAVLRLYPGSEVAFRELAEAYGRRRGWQKVQRVVRKTDGRSGSVGETVSRNRMDEYGFVAPELQVELLTDGRSEFADFGWEEVLGLGEFDGEVKYRLDRYRKGGSVEDVVIREKNRENRLRRIRPRFARWDWRDVFQNRLEGILIRAGIPKRNR